MVVSLSQIAGIASHVCASGTNTIIQHSTQVPYSEAFPSLRLLISSCFFPLHCTVIAILEVQPFIREKKEAAIQRQEAAQIAA
jgi:hypothetical protein